MPVNLEKRKIIIIETRNIWAGISPSHANTFAITNQHVIFYVILKTKSFAFFVTYRAPCSVTAAGRSASCVRCSAGWSQHGSPWVWGSPPQWCTWLPSAQTLGHSTVRRCIVRGSPLVWADTSCNKLKDAHKPLKVQQDSTHGAQEVPYQLLDDSGWQIRQERSSRHSTYLT